MLLKCQAARPAPPRGSCTHLPRPSGTAIRPPPHPRPICNSTPATLSPIRYLSSHNSIFPAFSHYPIVSSNSCAFSSHPKLQLPSFTNSLGLRSGAMALAMNARTAVGTAVPAHAVAGISSFKQTTSVRFNNGAVVFKRASLVVRAEEKVEPGPGGRSNAPTSPTSPPGLSGTEIPLSVISSTAPLEQGSDKPVGERIAYVCQDCGYVYDDETPFEDVSDEYNCPQCQAPKIRFVMANASVEEMLDTTKEEDAVSRGSGEKSGSPPSQS